MIEAGNQSASDGGHSTNERNTHTYAERESEGDTEGGLLATPWFSLA